MFFVVIATLPLKPWAAFTFVPVRLPDPLPEEDDIQRGSKKRELDELRRSLIRKKASLSLNGGRVSGGD